MACAMKNQVKVIDVKFPPTIGKVDFLSGIRNKEEAQRWGEKHGYLTVYFLANRQRVYAERKTVISDQLAVDSDQQSVSFAPSVSNQPLAVSEKGQGLVEYIMILVFVAIVIFVICKDWPW